MDSNKEVGLEANREETKHMLMSRCQNDQRNHSIKIANRYFEIAEKIRYLEMTNKSKLDSRGD
jgi:hypothetical protein